MANIKTIKQFTEQSNIPDKLIRATIRQFGGWEAFKEQAQDVYSHGIAGGFGGFIYYTDTVAFTKQNKSEILLLATDMAEQLDEGGIISFLSGFNCLKGYTQEEIANGLFNPRSDEQMIIYNALAWFAAEEVARAYCEAMEDY